MNQESLNGFDHSIAEIDEALMAVIPGLQRSMHREVAVAAMNELLDQRNEVLAIMRDLIMQEFEENLYERTI